MKHRIRVWHIPTGHRWDSVPISTGEDELTEIIKAVAASGTYFSFETDDTAITVFPGQILRESVIMLIEVAE